ncbi:MAG TPA: DUF3313 domain-containing protein [Candidatus Binataceae bacterium]|nr:DUF3313 domain-containing protein [Candidatus Binataceae bacterium]
MERDHALRMIGKPRRLIRLAGVGAALLLLGVAGCSETQQEQPNIVAKAQGAQNPVPQFSGFLGDYSLLQPGGENQALYRYVAPGVNWQQYNAVMIDPVTFWDSADSSVSPEEQQDLCTYFYNHLRESLVKYFQVVDQPGPGVMRIQVALTNASAATPVLRTASVVIPQMRIVNRLKSFATGSFAFVGSARGEFKLTDSVTGQILAEALDQQMGGNAVQTAATWQWGDTERAMDKWSNEIADRLNQLHTTGTISAPAGSASAS